MGKRKFKELSFSINTHIIKFVSNLIIFVQFLVTNQVERRSYGLWQFRFFELSCTNENWSIYIIRKLVSVKEN